MALACVDCQVIWLYDVAGANRNWREKVMEDLWLVLFWTGPIGVGLFLALLGVFIYLLARANEVNKRVSRKDKERKEE